MTSSGYHGEASIAEGLGLSPRPLTCIELPYTQANGEHQVVALLYPLSGLVQIQWEGCGLFLQETSSSRCEAGL